MTGELDRDHTSQGSTDRRINKLQNEADNGYFVRGVIAEGIDLRPESRQSGPPSLFSLLSRRRACRTMGVACTVLDCILEQSRRNSLFPTSSIEKEKS